jgi:hypothetical protein
MIRIYVILTIIIFSHNSEAYDKLAEFTFGKVWATHEQFLEIGLDFEYFPDQFSHRLSFGLASEIEFEKENEFYAGPLVSIYLSHVKVFLTSGLQGHNSFWRLKTRGGIGYDFHLPNEYLIIPNLTLDFIDHEMHPGVNIGLAKMF